MRVLILGGIAEAKLIAEHSINSGYRVIYSLVGMVRQPKLDCQIHLGGFSTADHDGQAGLEQYCRQQAIELLIDATHPYAQAISDNAAKAAQRLAIPCWRFNRPGWNKAEYPNWHDYSDWHDLRAKILPYHRPFFSIGLSALAFCDQRPEHQHWLIRSARAFKPHAGVIPINEIGPFDYQAEFSLFNEHNIDALISKNSGCLRVHEKMRVARDLAVPAFVLKRPQLPSVDREFATIEAIEEAVTNLAAKLS
jgi:precorrin-6A/cobalt-precorrin-6A reductase